MMYIICSAGYMEERVRLNKLKEVLLSKQIKFFYLGWLRGKKYKKKDIEYNAKHLWIGGGYANKALLLHYPLWIVSVFFNALRLTKKDVVYAVGFDVAFPVYLAAKIKRFKYIFDNPDNFSLTYNLKNKKKELIDKLEEIIAKNAVFHILPSEIRFPPKFGNEIYIPNFPLESEYIKAKKIFNNEFKASFDVEKIKNDKRFKIYINGRITPQRGSKWISKVISKLDEKLFLIIIAGDINCDQLKKVVKNKSNVMVLNRLPNYEALSIYLMIDIVFAFYDPAIPINKKAEPNKWWDCVKCKVPFISNNEIETLKPFREKKACFEVPYNDVERLLNLLVELQKDRKKLNEVKENLEKLNVKDWELMIENILKELKEEK
jgi:glycosyltransferase involved in cell wall biosynthesis